MGGGRDREPDTVPARPGDRVCGAHQAADAGPASDDTTGGAPTGSMPDDRRAPPLADDERYRPRALLGRGGMGEVWSAVDRRMGREIAIKVATGERADRAALARFLREARVQARLDHPGVVPVHDLGTRPDGSVFFTMQRVRGETLAAVLAARAAGDEDVRLRHTVHRLLLALVSVCHAVEAAHAHGLLHRDLKPANIMLGERGEVYVLDWGLAKPIAAAAGAADAIDDGDDLARAADELADLDAAGAALAPAERGLAAWASVAQEVETGGRDLTGVGQFLGTPGYMAPEQARGEPIDERVDVYALGATLFELLAGAPLIPRGSTIEVIARTAAGPDARASLRGHPHIPPELEELCARAAAPERLERLAAVADLRQGLEAYLEGDRDLERRRALAEEAVSAAAADVSRALAGDARARAAALAGLGRALAIAPDHADAQRLLVELMVTPPASAPAEVERAVAAAEDATYLRLAGAGTWIFLAWLPLALVMVWMGIKDVTPLLVWVGCTVATALAMLVAHARARPGPLSFFATLALANTSILLASRVSGTLVLTPTLFTMNAVGFAIAARRAWLLPTIAVSGGFLVAPTLLEAAGVLAPTTVFEDGTLRVTSTVVELREPATSVAAIGASLAFLVMVTIAAASLRRRFLDQTRKVELALWQLRQLVPRLERPARRTTATLDAARADDVRPPAGA
jgi:serine/threonine-protein kinase